MANNLGWRSFLENVHDAAQEEDFDEDTKRYEEEFARNNAKIETLKARIIAKDQANARYAAENDELQQQ